MNPNIILSGQQPNMLNTLAQSNALAQQTNEMKHQRELRDLFKTHGPGIAAGEQNALNALAMDDPFAANSIMRQNVADQRYADETKYDRRRNARTDARADQAMQLEITKLQAQYGAAAVKAERDNLARILSGAAHFYQNGDEAGYNAWLSQNQADPTEYPFKAFPAHAAQFKPVLDALDAFAEPELSASQSPYAIMVGPDDPNRASWGIPDDGKTYEVEVDPNTGRPTNFSVPGGSSTSVTVEGSKLETEYDKTRGKAFGTLANTLQDSGRTARRTLTALDAMERASKDGGFYSGLASGGVQFAKRAATALGFDASGVESMEAFNAIAKQAALDVMGGSLGTGFSNADRDFVLDQVPGLQNTPQGNALLIEVQRAMAQRQEEIAKLARDYERENGRIDLGFEDQLAEFSDQNPVFTDQWWLETQAQLGVSPDLSADELHYLGFQP